MPCFHFAPLAEDALFCPHCGTPTINPTTADLHRRMALLNERWMRGELSAPDYERESQGLMQFDPWGRAWLPGAEPGIWQVHHEGQWRPSRSAWPPSRRRARPSLLLKQCLWRRPLPQRERVGHLGAPSWAGRAD